MESCCLRNVPQLTPEFEAIVRRIFTQHLGLDTPCEWQLRLAQAVAFPTSRNKVRAACCQATGMGKSMPTHCMSTMLRGVAICLVPLQALGSDQ